MILQTFKNIIAWQVEYKLTLQVYKLTTQYPKCEEFGLKSQLRRASVSIISNITKGFKKGGKRSITILQSITSVVRRSQMSAFVII